MTAICIKIRASKDTKATIAVLERSGGPSTVFTLGQDLARLPLLQKLIAASTMVQRRGDWVEYRTPGGGTVHVLEPV